MKPVTKFRLLFLLAVLYLLFSCSGDPEKEIPGIWKPVEVLIDADTAFVDKQRLLAMEKLEKSVFFRLNEDKTMLAYTGGATILGTWSYEENTQEVFVQFEGSTLSQPTLLGKYSGGELIKTHELPNMKVTTTYRQE